MLRGVDNMKKDTRLLCHSFTFVFLFLCSMLLVTPSLRCGNAWVNKYHRPYTLNYYLVILPDETPAIATWPYRGGERQLDIWLSKLDEKGQILWQKTIGRKSDDTLIDLFATPDNHLILSGHSQLHGHWLMKMTTDGEIKWSKKGYFAFTHIYNVDNGMIGFLLDPFSDMRGFVVQLLDENGMIKRSRFIRAGDAIVASAQINARKFALSITDRIHKTIPQWINSFRILIVNDKAHVEKAVDFWFHRHVYISEMKSNQGRELIILGEILSESWFAGVKIFVMKLLPGLRIKWIRQYWLKPLIRKTSQTPMSVEVMEDGSIIIGGWYNETSDNGKIKQRGFLFSINKHGIPQWAYSIKSPPFFLDDYFYLATLKKTPSGKYIFAGGSGPGSLILIKLDREGNLLKNCDLFEPIEVLYEDILEARTVPIENVSDEPFPYQQPRTFKLPVQDASWEQDTSCYIDFPDEPYYPCHHPQLKSCEQEYLPWSPRDKKKSP